MGKEAGEGRARERVVTEGAEAGEEWQQGEEIQEVGEKDVRVEAAVGTEEGRGVAGVE